MKQFLFDVFRTFDGTRVRMFTGTREDCLEWIGRRDDVGVAYYSIENPHEGGDDV